jgi:hypothetical protein
MHLLHLFKLCHVKWWGFTTADTGYFFVWVADSLLFEYKFPPHASFISSAALFTLIMVNS